MCFSTVASTEGANSKLVRLLQSSGQIRSRPHTRFSPQKVAEKGKWDPVTFREI